MSISNVSQVKSIALKLEAGNSNIKTIYSNNGLAVGDELIANHKIISFSCFIKNLRVFASVTSLEEAPLPDFALDDTATAKRQKVLDVEWKSPRKQLNLYITNVENPTLNNWLQVGSVSLLNPYGYSFRVYNVMDLFTDNLALELGENGKIGISVEDVGNGLLSNEDRVVIHGSYTEEIFLQSPDIPIVVNVIGGSNNGSIGEAETSLLSNTSSIGNQFLVAN